MIRIWLLGGDVSASPSPAMHTAALAAMGIPGWYRAVSVEPRELDEWLGRLRAGEADGANVTIPYKRTAAAACARLEGDAELLGAVNTLVVEGGALVGANTDTSGLEAAMRDEGIWPQRRAELAVIVGTGGAAAAAALVAGRWGAERVVVAGRRAVAAEELAERLSGSTGAAVEGRPLDDRSTRELLGSASLLVNATPAGVAELGIDPARLPPGAVVVDLRYRPRPVDLVAAAAAAGRRACDGLPMLLFQGMHSLRRWTGVEPAYEAARAALLATAAR